MNDSRPMIQLPDAHHDTPYHDVTDLMQGGRIAYIQNDGQVYTLRITRAGKLILTK